jgi:RHS repeat-associated protein
VWADYNATGAITARYLTGDNPNEMVARWRPADGTAWYLTDHLGTVRDITNAAGAVVDHLDYDSFGNVVAETNPSAGDRFRFTGQQYEAVTGLYSTLERFYSPQMGRFLTQDPLGIAAGDTTLYRYVFNSPQNVNDPFGLIAASEDTITEFQSANVPGYTAQQSAELIEAEATIARTESQLPILQQRLLDVRQIPGILESMEGQARIANIEALIETAEGQHADAELIITLIRQLSFGI